MSNPWDLARVRRIAGLQPLNESIDDDDDGDVDPDVAVADRDPRQRQFERRNRRDIKTAEREAAELAKKQNSGKGGSGAKSQDKAVAKKNAATTKADVDKEEHKPAPSKETDDAVAKKNAATTKADVDKEEHKPAPSSTETDKHETPDSEAASKSRHREGSKTHGARQWLQANPGATRKEFMTHAKDKLGITHHHANTMFYALKKGMKVSEAFVLVHPSVPSFMLAENKVMRRLQWIDANSNLEPLIFETKASAEDFLTQMSSFMNQRALVEAVDLGQDE